MKPNADERIKEVFAQAMERKSPAEREKFLAEACRDEPELRVQVDSLLHAHAQAGDFLVQTVKLTESDFVIEPTGVMIGRYKLLEKIGEGGFGVVYMAEQVEPVQRKVALKIIKAGMDTREVVARFEAERQALALMDHPNIARVLDAGATEAGRPYFVMELVRGIAITDYCDRSNLSTVERLKLISKVCQAVQHAHQKGIIHRDLKPSNVLVTMDDGEPVPKVIDFGVAKALGQKLTEKTLFTGFQHMIGTPAYMSPEQAELSGLDIDTRADIYSLGVLLYELLTGVTPFDNETLRKAALNEICRLIRETEPLKPSTRLRTLGDKLPDVAKHRRTEPAALSRQVRGELDWIVMKCLEKDRTRRYETANGLAMDLKRFLNNEPVVAAAPSTLYLARKFVRRHKAGLAMTTVLVALLITGVVVSSWEAVRANQAQREQNQLRKLAEAARMQEAAQRRKADEAAQESLDHLVRLNVANGARLLDQGDQLGSLAWFSEAFKLDLGATNADSVHRLRLGMILRQCPRPVQMGFHADRVNAAMFSHDGRWALTASRDKTAKIWDVETGQAVAPAVVHSLEVAHACFSPDGSLTLSVGPDAVLLWRPGSGEIVHRLEHAGAFYATFSPDGRVLASAGSDRAVRLWDVASGEELLPPVRHDGALSHLAFSPDNRLLATGTYAGTGQLWDVSERKQLRTLRVGDSFRFLAFSPDSKRLAAADWAKAVYLWDVATGDRAAPLLRHEDMVAHVTFSSDGRWLASSSLDGTTKLWNPESGALLGSLPHPGFPMEARFSQDNTLLLTRRFDGWLHFWNVRSAKPALFPIRHTSWVTAADLHPDGRRVLAGCADGSVRVWDLRPDGASFWPWPDLSRSIVGVSRDGRQLLTQDRDFKVQVWDTDSWKPSALSINSTSRVVAAFLSEDAKRLMLVEPAYDGNGASNPGHWLRLWDFETGAIVSDFMLRSPSGSDPTSLFAATRDCQRLALGRGRVLEMWDVLAGKPLAKPWNHSTAIKVLQFSPDGDRLLVNCGRLLHIADAATGKEVLSPLTNTLATSAAEFSPDGRLVASAGSDTSYNRGEARIWKLATRGLVHAIVQSDGVPAVAFSPDGRWLATGCEDRTARVWNVLTGEPATPSLLHSGTVVSLAFSPDSQLLASVSDDGGVRVWDTLTGEAVTTPMGEGQGATQVRFLSGSRYLLTNARQGFQLWRLEGANLPAEDLVNLGQLFANHRVDKTGALEPLPLGLQIKLTEALRAQCPGFFSLTHHAQQTFSPGFQVPTSPREAGAGAEQIDLSGHYNARLADSWHGGAPGNDLANLPQGVQTFDGVRFDARGLVQLANRRGFAYEGRTYPERVQGIKVRLKCRRLHFLHAAGWSAPDGTEVGRYVMHYANGQQRVVPLIYGEDLRDWWLGRVVASPARQAAVAWETANEAGNRVCLYHRAWENPLPDIEISSIDFVSALTDCAPFLVALTAEP